MSLPAADTVTAFDRSSTPSIGTLPVRILQFGTGVLLRALVTPAIDRANQDGRGAGRVALIQSTRSGMASQFAAQGGRYSLVVRGRRDDQAVDDATIVDTIDAVWHVEDDWSDLRRAACQPTVQVIISNVTEAGFRLDPDDPHRLATGRPPASFPGRVAALLLARREALGDAAPIMLIIPTELVDDNGPQLRAMLAQALAEQPEPDAVAHWCATHVVIASSLVDRITTAGPAGVERESLDRQIGHPDPLRTVTEPYALWAVEGEPALLRELLPIDDPASGIIFARDIRPLRDRKLRLLNGAHTAMAPLAHLMGCPTVGAAVSDSLLGPLLRRLLFEELVPHAGVTLPDATDFARAVLDRFANPYIEHRWTTILGSHGSKVRHRLGPVFTDAIARSSHLPVMALSTAATALLARRGTDEPSLARLADLLATGTDRDAITAALHEETLWGAPIAQLPDFIPLVREYYLRARHGTTMSALIESLP